MATQTTPPAPQGGPVDAARAEAFAERMLEVFNNGCLSLMLSLGHRAGLLEALAEQPPATSDAIAQRASLDERYVREWLGAMVTARVVEYDPRERTYVLPAAHAASLTAAAGPDNQATLMQYVPLMGSVEDGILEAFRKGGGLPYSAYPRFQQVQGDETRRVFDATLLDVTLPLRPELVDRLHAGIDVADVGCGQGHALNLMAQAFPASRFVGYDFSPDGVATGRAEAERLGLRNAWFEQLDVAELRAVSSFDLITAFDAIHDQVRPRAVLRNVAEALRPGGTFLMVDIKASSELHENLDHPLATALFTFSTMHCMTVSLAAGGEGLGTVWGRQKALELLAEAGFDDVEVREVEGDIMNLYYFAQRRES